MGTNHCDIVVIQFLKGLPGTQLIKIELKFVPRNLHRHQTLIQPFSLKLASALRSFLALLVSRGESSLSLLSGTVTFTLAICVNNFAIISK
jgi:hypothetical protein